MGGFQFISDEAEQAATITRAIKTSLDPAEAERTGLPGPSLTQTSELLTKTSCCNAQDSIIDGPGGQDGAASDSIRLLQPDLRPAGIRPDSLGETDRPTDKRQKSGGASVTWTLASVTDPGKWSLLQVQLEM